MDVVHPRCAGIDCSKKDAKVCVRIQGHRRRRASSPATLADICALTALEQTEPEGCVVQM